MLASAIEYIRPEWEGVILIISFFVWVLGGGYLFQKTLSKATNNRKYSFGRGVLVSFLSGAAGGISSILLYYIGLSISPPEPNPEAIPISWLGLILAVIGYFPVTYLVVLSMYKLSAKQTLTASVLPILLPVLFAGVALGISFPFSAKSLQAKRKLWTLQAMTMNKLSYIHKTMDRNILQTGKIPLSLQELVSQGVLEPDSVVSPANPKGRGFFYNGGKPISDLASREIFICDYKDNFGDKGRTVLYRGGYVEFLTETSFQARLRQSENKDFAKALDAAEK